MNRYPRQHRRAWDAVDRRRWAAARRLVLARDNRRCGVCGDPGADQVHHRLQVRDHPDHVFDPDHLEAIHKGCHIQLHRPARAPGTDEWRQFVDELLR